MTGVPATSPGSTGSGSNLSPSCGGEPGPALSPLSSSRAGSGMAGDPMAGQILSDSSHLAALSGQNCLKPSVFILPDPSNDPKRQNFPQNPQKRQKYPPKNPYVSPFRFCKSPGVTPSSPCCRLLPAGRQYGQSELLDVPGGLLPQL